MRSEKRSRIRKIMDSRPNPDDQMFWVGTRFLIIRFREHYADFLNKVEMEMLKND